MTYERYWHGVLIYLKPLFSITDIRGVRIFQYVVLFTMLIILCILMVKRKTIDFMISFLIGMVAVSLWIVPYGLEFFPAFAVTFSICIYILLNRKKDIGDFGSVFLASGILISFFDFLTTELLSLLIPYMLILCLYKNSIEKWKSREHFYYFIKNAFIWGMAYASTFILKWTIASIVLQKNAFMTAIKSAEVRVNGTVSSSLVQQWKYGIIRNIRCLLPLDFIQTYGHFVLLLLTVIFIVGILLILFGRKPANSEKVIARVYLIVSLIPFVRFSVLINHSYLHYFFTYRVLLVDIIAMCYILLSRLKINK